MKKNYFIRRSVLQFLLFLIFICSGQFAFGQIYSNSFTGAGACPTNGNTPTMAANSTGTAITRNTITCMSTANVFNSTTLNNTASLSATSYIEFSATANAGYKLDLTSISFFRQASNSAPNQLEVRYSTDGFSTFTTWGATPNSPTSGTVATWDFTDFSTANAGTITFRLYPFGTQRADNTGASATSGTFRVDDVTINGTVTSIAPTISTSGTLAEVNTIYGTASSTPTSFSVSGSNLTNDILITPPSGFQVSQTVGGASGYADTQTLTQSGGNVSSTTIYLRLKANASVAGSPYSGDILVSSTGATSVNVPTVSSTVAAKNLTIAGLTANNKEYDGNNSAILNGSPSYLGLENSESFSVSGTPVATFNNAIVENAKSVTVTGFTAPSTNYTITQPSFTANIIAKALTINSPAATTKVYDGNTNATITGTLFGIVGSENVTLNGTGTFAQTNIGTGISVTSTSTLGGTNASNYSLTQPTGLSANITQKPLTISGLTADNKIFDGNTSATLTGTATLNGLVLGDEANVDLGGTPVATFAQSAVGENIPVTVSGYTISGNASENYALSKPTGLTASITSSPTPVINSPLTATGTYGVVATTYTITATNSPTSFNATELPDGLSINTTNGEITGTPTNVAGSPFSVTISATNLGGTTNATLVYTINKKTLTVNFAAAQNKEYDRTDVATITGTLNGIVGVDEVTFLGTGTFAQSTFGNGIDVNSTSTLGGADASKYVLTQPTGLTANITKKSLTVSGASAANKVYDSNTLAVISGAALVGVVNPDNVTVTGNGTFASSDVADNISVTTSLALGGADAGNYTITQPSGITANITPSPLTISGLSANNKEYDRTTTSTLTGTPVLNGIINSDDVSINGSGTAAFTNMNIGTAKPITVSGYTLSGTKAVNYSLIQPTTITADIIAKTLTITGAVAQNKNFDGNTNAIITGTLAGVISPDEVTFTGTGTFASSAVGNGIAVTAAITLGGAGASNYTITQPTGLTANIMTPQFTLGNLVVVNINSTNSASLIEYSNSGSLVQTFNIPSTGTEALTISYTATSEGALSRTSSGYYLGLVGYRTGTNGSATDRVIGRVNNFGVINAKSIIPNSEGYTGNNIRAAVFNDDGSRFWTSGTGTGGGIRTNIFESTSGSTQVSTTITNTRAINVFNNQLYVSSSTGTFQGISTVGNGIPINTGNTITLLSGFPTTTAGAYGFAINSANTIAYVADDRASAFGGIQKWTFNGSVWTLSYTLGTGVTNIGARGLTVDWSGGNPIVYATTAEASLNRIIKIEDTGVSSLPTTLATSATNNIFRGIAFAPILAPTTVNLSVSASNASEAGSTVITVTATASSPVLGEKTVSIAVSGTNITTGDYTLSNTSITILDGQTTGTVTFTIVDDALLESSETATLTISNPSSGLTLGAVTTQDITITDNDNTAPTIAIDASSTNNYVDGGSLANITGSYALSGVINDPTDPALNYGIDFIISDAETAVGSLIVTATSSNGAVVPNANLNLSGSGSSRNLKITPIAAGYSTITVTVNDGITSTNFLINYASSQASVNPTTTRFHSGKSDASTAISVDADLMLVADDEDQFIRLYNRSNSGLPINAFDFTSVLGLTDPNTITPREVDIEASTKIGNDIYWLGSESNASSGNNRPNRNRVFKTSIAGTGATTTLSYVSRYDFLKDDILAWDANNVHGKGANYYGLVTSATPGLIPESAALDGFNIEGVEMAPDNTTAYIAFRAPQVIPSNRKKALIIPVSNFTTILTPTGGTLGSATFGTPIEINLGGRGIREIRKNAANEYLIIAGPADGSTGVAPKDFKFFTWSGNPVDEPVKRSYNLSSLDVDGSFESIVEMPASLSNSSSLQILVDNGDAIYYGDGTIAKELAQSNHKKFRSELVLLSAPSLAIGTISGAAFCKGSTVNVPFTFTNETFNNGNIFTAQLSDENGSFVSPVAIGTLTDVNAGTISATIPNNAIAGSNYRIRIVSSNPEIIGGDNGSNLTINLIPSKPTITPTSSTICAGVSTTLTASACDGGTLNWTDGLYGASVTVSPATTKMYKVACTISGCTSDSSDATTVTVNQKPTPPIVTATPSTITVGQTSSLSATGCDGGIITWIFNNSNANPLSVSPSNTTAYTATCTLNGCVSNISNTVTVTVNSTGPCESNVTLSSTSDDYPGGVQLKQANSSNGKIQATNKVTGSAIVTYQAKAIELSPGFRADNGTVFKAEIGGCN